MRIDCRWDIMHALIQVQTKSNSSGIKLAPINILNGLDYFQLCISCGHFRFHPTWSGQELLCQMHFVCVILSTFEVFVYTSFWCVTVRWTNWNILSSSWCTCTCSLFVSHRQSDYWPFKLSYQHMEDDFL